MVGNRIKQNIKTKMSEKYIVKILFGQRKGSYEGEYAPEVLDAIDEYGNDENPDFLKNKFADSEYSKEFSSLKIIDIQLDRTEIDKILNPENKTIQGKIV